MWITLFNGLLVALGPLALWLLKHFSQKLTDMLSSYVQHKTNSEAAGTFIKRLDEAAMRIVKTVYMTYVEAIKKGSGGKLTDEEQRRAKSLALDKLKSYLGPAGLEELAQIFNFSMSEREKMLDDHIESAVYDIKHGPHSGLRNGSISLAGRWD